MADSAKYRLTVEERGAYVFACVNGEAPPAGGSAAYLEVIADYCFRCHCGAMLIEKHLPQPFVIWDAFAVAPRLADAGPPHVKMAVVEKAAPLPPKKELTIAIGRERTLDVQLFTDASRAESWLLQAPPN
jgi:hypothetical protein